MSTVSIVEKPIDSLIINYVNEMNNNALFIEEENHSILSLKKESCIYDELVRKYVNSIICTKNELEFKLYRVNKVTLDVLNKKIYIIKEDKVQDLREYLCRKYNIKIGNQYLLECQKENFGENKNSEIYYFPPGKCHIVDFQKLCNMINSGFLSEISNIYSSLKFHENHSSSISKEYF